MGPMRGLSRWSLCAGSALATACTFGATGAGSGSGSDGPADTDGGRTSSTDGGPGPSSTMSASAGEASTAAPTDDGTGATASLGETTAAVDDSGTSGSSGSADAPGTSTGVDECAGPGEELVVFAEDADIVAPMQLTVSSLLPGNPMVASSAVAEAGTATFTFDVACEGEFRVWGLVWDYEAGADNGADSFYAAVDGEPGEHDWYYGCQTGGGFGSAWSYQRVMDWVMFDCIYDDLVFPLAPGTHTLTLRNRETGYGESVAAIAAIVVSSDPATDPADLYDPSP